MPAKISGTYTIKYLMVNQLSLNGVTGFKDDIQACYYEIQIPSIPHSGKQNKIVILNSAVEKSLNE